MAIDNRKIAIVGCGPGSLDYLTPLAQRTIMQAEILVGAKRLLDLFPESRAERILVGADIEGVLNAIGARIENKIAVLVTGDPGICSLAKPVIRRFGRPSCEVIPGISSAQLAFSKLGIDWTDASIISAHAKNPPAIDSGICDSGKLAILAGRDAALNWIGQFAQTLGTNWRIYVCENLSLENESIVETDTASLPSLSISTLAIVLLIRKDHLE